jgi:hypothetical protein
VSVAVRPPSVHFSLEKLHSRVIPTIFSTCDAVVVHGMVLRISDVAGRSDTPSRCFSLYPCPIHVSMLSSSFGSSPLPLRVYPIPGSRLVKATSHYPPQKVTISDADPVDTVPSVKRIVYSTCSVHPTENEHVVSKALESSEAKLNGFRLAPRPQVLSSWHRRGIPEEMMSGTSVRCFVREMYQLVAVVWFSADDAECVVRCSPGEDARTAFSFPASCANLRESLQNWGNGVDLP